MGPKVIVPYKKRIHDLLDLFWVLGMPMAEAVKGAELQVSDGKSRTSDITLKVA